MRDVVLIPTHERPEFTRVCLKYLAQTDRIADKEVCFFIDNHNGKDFREVFDEQLPNLRLASDLFPGRTFTSCQAGHDTYGNSKNVVDALQWGYNSGAERIYLLEDDIAVAPDFFSWHESVLEEPDVFVSCSTALSKSAHFQINGPQAMDETFRDPSAYFLTEGPYSSHAAAFKRDNLGSLLKYLSMIDDWHSGGEQDMLTQKFLKFTHQKSAWPYIPRAYNYGWYSYHLTGRPFTGSLLEKAVTVEETIKDQTRLRDVSSNNNAVTVIPNEWPMRQGSVKNVQLFR